MQDKNKILFSAQRQVVRRRIKYLQRILSVCFLLSSAYLVWYRLDSQAVARKNQELQRIAVQTAQMKEKEEKKEKKGDVVETPGEETLEASDNSESDSAAESEPEETQAEPVHSYCIAGYEQLLQINSDLKGWISIPGTVLSLPVVQGGDNSYYLDHDFYGKQDRHGTIFIDCGAHLEDGAFNTVIYGHHMRDGSMFGILKEYRKEEFYREHPVFFISLPEEEREYEILAVVRNDIFEGNQENFQYYDYKQITDETAFAAYCQALKENAVYDTGVEAKSGDELVTLCTCDYGSTDQRLLVVGRRKIQENLTGNG